MQMMDGDGLAGYFDNFKYYQIGEAGVVSIENNSSYSSIPTSFTLNQNYPNPFNPVTTISFDLVETANVSLNIYNINGQLVRELANGLFTANTYNLKWNATNDFNQTVPSGIYLYVLKVNEQMTTKRMVYLK
ncbi:MAG: T9SS type A sorting domain-containing protein [Candidatus Marinimicrobia bacterium]|nr:T9SS type A sorting domain-containing protein [Candidatus Neomarinimicrobiota bacterium]